ncbi:unnamed protein product [Lactuca saligna]|uniref:DUF4219 domain-containing protein n=1 Tax=Lactuca saligna TaxID=75948 RepID=A0AA35ZBV7_LACSI|nr:unnamed protein product [Lactuca saligna]
MSLVKEGGLMTFQVPVLTPTNYPVWGIKVKLIIDAYDIWETVESRVFNGRISRNMIDQQMYDCQVKKGMDKQHGVNIMAVEVQIGWLWIWPGRGCESGKSQDGNERIERDLMVHVMCVVNNQNVWKTLDVTEVEVGCRGKVENRGGCCLGKTGCWNKVQQDYVWFDDDDSRSMVNKGCECGGVRWWLMTEKHSCRLTDDYGEEAVPGKEVAPTKDVAIEDEQSSKGRGVRHFFSLQKNYRFF